MILGDHKSDAGKLDHAFARETLDGLFKHALARRPDAVALSDPPDRERFTDHPPRRLTYADVDRAVAAIAGMLRGFGLPADSIVGVQLPNIVESVVVLLGVLRAGLIAAPIPLLWRTAETAASLARIGARALVTCRQVGDVDHAELAMQVAADTFAIRFVCAFGHDLSDGVVPLDGIFLEPPSEVPALARVGRAADHVAVVTFDVTAGGIMPVGRSHAELIAGGSAVLLEAAAEPGVTILGAFATSSFAGLASTVVPWLISGGTLSLHQPFAPATFAAQCAGERSELIVVPGPLVLRLLEAGLVGDRHDRPGIVAVWRAPERFSASAAWPDSATPLTDVPVFGEIGLVARRRGAGGKPAALPVGRIPPAGSADAATVIEVTRTAHGTVALRGPMVPRHPFPPGVTRGDQLRLNIDAEDYIDTEYACRVERDTKALVVNGAPPGVISVGGYRFALRDLQNLVTRLDEAGSLAALPDLLAGHRLAGAATDRDAMRQALAAHGANPLLVAAFRGRRAGRASAA